jgi:hypothetical protein
MMGMMAMGIQSMILMGFQHIPTGFRYFLDCVHSSQSNNSGCILIANIMHIEARASAPRLDPQSIGFLFAARPVELYRNKGGVVPATDLK